MIVHQRRFMPAFGLPDHTDQMPLCVYTVLSINESVRDCAAYEGIGPTDADDALIEQIKAGGTKISESEARQLFDEIDDMELRYRL